MHTIVVVPLIRISLIALTLLPAFSSAHADETVISHDTLWSGEISLTKDVLVLQGATLTIAPGTRINVLASESTRTEPEFISSYTEITVRGILRAEGSQAQPIVMTAVMDNKWAGIIVDEGSVSLTWCKVSGADAGLTVLRGKAVVRDCQFIKNHYGISLSGRDAKLSLNRSVFQENDYGLAVLNGAEVAHSDSKFIANKHRDVLESPAFAYDRGRTATYQAPTTAYKLPDKKESAPYQSESLLGTVVWTGRITVHGIIRIPAKSRLIIMPGTIVEFSKNDTNGDGIGENGLLVMGMLIAKGTADAPIIFRSAEKTPHAADWDAINIYTSDGFQNLLEYVQVEDAYRAVHIHFSNVLLNHAVLHGNYRGLQFQESVVEVKNSQIYDNKSSVRARDSELNFINNLVHDNYAGPNIFRMTGRVEGNIFANNYYDGLRVREGALEVTGNAMLANRYGMTIAYANFGVFVRNVLMDNLENGLALKGVDNVKVSANFIQSNGANGISLRDSKAQINGNQIGHNGERGIAIISFNGSISANNIVDNDLYGLGLDCENDINAAGNWWGDGADMARIIYDKDDEARLGRVSYEPVLDEAAAFTWPLAILPVDTIWQGRINVNRKINTLLGATLDIAPGTIVTLEHRRGIWANGNIRALGTADKRIKIIGEKDGAAGRWHQIMVEKAHATFVNCDFDNAETALHSHFSELEVRGCTFRNNDTGMMFKGGPVQIKASSFTNNAFGLVFNKARGRVTASLISDNDVGIMVRDQEKDGMSVAGSNIYQNHRYNLKMGDFNNGENIDVRNNWWGTKKTAATIFDDRVDPGIGRAVFEPVASAKHGVPN
jgi:hypothetical protein